MSNTLLLRHFVAFPFLLIKRLSLLNVQRKKQILVFCSILWDVAVCFRKPHQAQTQTQRLWLHIVASRNDVGCMLLCITVPDMTCGRSGLIY